MRSTLLTFCAAAVVAAVLVPDSAALAEPGPAPVPVPAPVPGGDRTSGISLTARPPTAGPGGEVELRLAGCAGRTATGESDAFVAAARFSPAADGGLYAETRISSDAPLGDHTIRVTCTDDRSATGTTGTAGATSTAGTTGTVTVTDRGRATPLAPVAAGGGGAALFAAGDERREGPGTAHAVTGLVLAAVTAVAVALRGTRRRRRRRPAAD
ncbi:hypothetical protein ACFVWY_19090 [Streptomyces sp. NPDC058195]|uniref:hypothetical protein n=1 Tax=Streptomyces sp. NPDC058195 TaxID=3346375 RepID=UPI0036E581D8